jgi:hypothetical protein
MNKKIWVNIEYMKTETLMILLILSPRNIKKNHPFWKELFKAGIKLEQENIKIKDLKRTFEYFKSNWRYHKNIIIDFYTYLKLNFPNPIPFPLFFYCEYVSNGNIDYNVYHEDLTVLQKTRHLEDKLTEELQFDESIHYVENEYDDDYYDYDYYYDDEDYYEDIKKVLINLADKWLKDILGGESFYERNKDYFTKNEVKHFLTCEWFESDIKLVTQSSYMDLLQYYWKVKIRANGLNLSSYFFVDKFIEHHGDPITLNYFNFICRNKKVIRDINEIYDISDYIFRDRFNGNFNNMTWQDLRHLSDEWHREIELQEAPYDFVWDINKPRENQINKKWEKKTVFKDFTLTVDGKTWTINEITTGKLLYEEGKDMHNCVFSYLQSCISGHCTIFSVKVNDKRMATLEISTNNSEFQLVQAREKMNASIKNEEIKKIILIWLKENNINIQENIFGEYADEQIFIENNIFEEDDNDYEERLNKNIDIANNDNLLDGLEDEFYARLYHKYIESDENAEKK